MAINKKKAETKKAAENHEIKVLRAHEFKSGDIGFDAEVNGVKLYGLTYVDTGDGRKNDKPFISFPSRQGSDKKWYNLFWFEVTDDDFDTIERLIEEVMG